MSWKPSLRADKNLYIPVQLRKGEEVFTLLTDTHGCFVVKREEMQRLVDELQRTLDQCSDDDIIALEKWNTLRTDPEKFARVYGKKDPMWRDDLLQQFRARQNLLRQTGPAPSRQGYVYVVAGNGFYKIGLTKRPKRRVQDLIDKAPFPVEVLFFIRTQDRHQTERDLHDRFAAKRTNGEWFQLTPEDIAWMQETYDVLSPEEGGEA